MCVCTQRLPVSRHPALLQLALTCPISPVWSQPSTSVSLVFSSRLWYPWNTFGPRRQISPRGKGLSAMGLSKGGGEGEGRGRHAVHPGDLGRLSFQVKPKVDSQSTHTHAHAHAHAHAQTHTHTCSALKAGRWAYQAWVWLAVLINIRARQKLSFPVVQSKHKPVLQQEKHARTSRALPCVQRAAAIRPSALAMNKHKGTKVNAKKQKNTRKHTPTHANTRKHTCLKGQQNSPLVCAQSWCSRVTQRTQRHRRAGTGQVPSLEGPFPCTCGCSPESQAR